MSDKNKKNKNYSLKSDAINRLANADKMEIPSNKNTADPGKQYRSNFLDKIPSPIKALFIKFWFSGAVCFFILWGLGIANSLDALIVASIVLGLVADILVNNILRFIEIIPNENAKWIMFPQKKFWTLPANILYALVVFFSVRSLYILINSVGHSLGFYLGVEPILFGIFYTSFDLLFVGMKNLVKNIVQDAKDKVHK